MAALNQATGQNIASQSALMAGQRGSGANAGLLARQAAQQGAATQQQAVGQGATMQAQQSLAAMQQLGAQQANMANLANTQVNQQQAGLTGLNQNTLQQQANLYGLQSNANSANAGIANTNAAGQGNILGGVMGGIGSATNLIGGSGSSDSDLAGAALEDNILANGGMVKMADGGITPSYDPLMQATSATPQVQTLDNPTGPKSIVGKMFNDSNNAPTSKSTKAPANPLSTAASGLTKGLVNTVGKYGGELWSGLSTVGSDIGTWAGSDALPAVEDYAAADVAFAAYGGKVPALVSPGEIRIHAKDVKKVADGKKSPLDGEKIPGKPKIGGAKNSYANDIVPKTLNEGDIILPRSVTQAKHPHWAAHKFVQDIMMQKHRKKK